MSEPTNGTPELPDPVKLAAAKKRTEDLISRVKLAFGDDAADDDVAVLLFGIIEHMRSDAGKKARADGRVTGNGVQTRAGRRNVAIIIQVIEDTDKRSGSVLQLPGRDF